MLRWCKQCSHCIIVSLRYHVPVYERLTNFAAAKHISTLAVKFKIWALLDHIESQLGFHTGHRIKQLQQQIKGA
jgi:hypothetical protein